MVVGPRYVPISKALFVGHPIPHGICTSRLGDGRTLTNTWLVVAQLPIWTFLFKGREKAAEEESAFQKQLKDAKAAQAQQDENRSSDSNGQGRSVDVESECDYSDANENVLKGNFKAMVRVSLD